MKKEINKMALLEDIIEASLEVMDIDRVINSLIESYDGIKDLDWLLYDLVDNGYGTDELRQYGWQDWEVEKMSNRVMHGMGPE
jgi:hypothetical protein